MRFVDEYRDRRLIRRLAQAIAATAVGEPLRIMEVCGTHTHNFFRFGLDGLLPEELSLVAGPGCPVCVSTQDYIDEAIGYAQDPAVTIATFGDMLQVPGTRSSLAAERANGASIAVVYSPLDCLALARKHPRRTVVFLAVGFETTAATIALAVARARQERLENLLFFSSLKRIPPAMEALARDRRLRISGFLCPGHVSSIIGTKPYGFIAKRYTIPCCVAGFEPLDIMEGLLLLLRQIRDGRNAVENQYRRAVKDSGNLRAQQAMEKCFTVTDAAWRGLGVIAKSGLRLRQELRQFDAAACLPSRLRRHKPDPLQARCRCADVLKGLIAPTACPLFGRACMPTRPVGPCMVSHEGACNAYFRYR